MNIENFYLGTHVLSWLGQVKIPLFISHRQLRKRNIYKLQTSYEWALDSGGFSELSMFGHWTITAKDYVIACKRYNEIIGNLKWCAIQDYMCEPFIINKTGLTVKEHQIRTINSFIELTSLAPEINFIPIIQGFTINEYLEHLEMYDKANINLSAFDTVGIGSVCRRQATKEIAELLQIISSHNIKLHGFGVKKQGLALAKNFLYSADSMAWSYNGRQERIIGHTHGNCANCLEYALDWYDDIKQILT